MYKKKQKIQSSITNLSNYISGFDVYDSYLFQKLSDPSLNRESYLITVNEYRPDLIAKDFYGDSGYMGFLLLQTKAGILNLKRGTTLSLLPKNTIDRIISEL